MLLYCLFLMQFLESQLSFQQSLKSKFELEKQQQRPHNLSLIHCQTFSNSLVFHLRQCIKSVVIGEMDKSHLRKSLLTSKARIELLHMIIKSADLISVDAEESTRLEWGQIRETFMALIDSKLSSS